MLSLPRLRVRRAGRVSKGGPVPLAIKSWTSYRSPGAFDRIFSITARYDSGVWVTVPHRAMAHVRRSHEFYGKVEVPLFEYLVHPSFESRHVPFFNRRHCVPPWQHRACPE